MNRRDFIVGATSAAGVAITTTLPWLAGPVLAAPPTHVQLSDWSIDDMWGVYPRYAEAIDYPHTRKSEARLAVEMGSIEALFYA